MAAARCAASKACWCATAAAAAVAAAVGIEEVTPADAIIPGEDFFWLGELRERADFGLARDLGVGGSAEEAFRGVPRGPVIVTKQ